MPRDMPKHAVMAFCSFYDSSQMESLQQSPTDRYDWVHKKQSGLTKLHFKLKPMVTDESLVKSFTVTLYPNSVFLIPLSTNRLYTHEIRPSALSIDKIPTRMGYVVRCSDMEALFMKEQTYIKEGEEWMPLEPVNQEGMNDLRMSYLEENKTDQNITYNKIHFSMNSGDYKRPIY